MNRMLIAHPLRLVLALLLSLTTVSCNTYPVHSLLENFRVRVTDKLSADEPVKLDFLWVVDHSASMCQEQRDLAKGFQSFITKLQSLGSIDAQMAVVTVQQVPDKTDIKVVGRFMHRPATALPANCMERVRLPCINDSQCSTPYNFTFPTTTDGTLCSPNPMPVANSFTSGKWQCVGPDAKDVANTNCSINSYCEARCSDTKNHTDCRALFEPDVPKDKQRIKCVVPGGGANTGNAGCLYPPESEGCPPADQLPAVLKADQLDLFRCNATLGAGQSLEAGFEGGFRSAWVALDPDGPNCNYDACVAHLRSCCVDGGEWCKSDQNDAKCAKDKAEFCEELKDETKCQNRALLRDDAYLVIVFVSDDDDCSVDPAINPLDKKFVTKEDWGVCQKIGDAKAGNQELNEGNCEFRRSKNAGVYCPSDCVPGATTKDPSGKLKCPNGCKDGSPEQATCQEAVEAGRSSWVRKKAAFPPVGEWVNRFKSLKNDPARVIVASIAGDTIDADAGTQTGRDRVNYYRSSFADVASKQTPYICEGARGEAGYGSRYIEMATSFRENGVVQNICKGADFGSALENIATTILKRVIKVCLPQPPYDVDGVPSLNVSRTRNGVAEVMELTDGPVPGNDKSFYIAPSPDCRAGKADLPGQLAACKVTRDCSPGLTCIDGLCQAYNDAIFFSEVPQPTDVIEINYAADLGL
ncbi:MAG: hypothetical protein RIT45_1545 [Pseudomonadota bacterium]